MVEYISGQKHITDRSQVITQELASELVSLRVSNIYDLSSVRSIPYHGIFLEAEALTLNWAY